MSSSSQQIPSEVSDLPIAIAFSRHHASCPHTPSVFTWLVTCHRHELTAIVSWGGNCFYMTAEFLLPLGVITHCCYLVIAIKAQKDLQTGTGQQRWSISARQSWACAILSGASHAPWQHQFAECATVSKNLCPAKGFNCTANCLVFSVGGVTPPHPRHFRPWQWNRRTWKPRSTNNYHNSTNTFPISKSDNVCQNTWNAYTVLRNFYPILFPSHLWVYKSPPPLYNGRSLARTLSYLEKPYLSQKCKSYALQTTLFWGGGGFVVIEL